ncbi:MAG: hypothetical protein ACJ8CC_08790 [Microvirga sp.]
MAASIAAAIRCELVLRLGVVDEEQDVRGLHMGPRELLDGTIVGPLSAGEGEHALPLGGACDLQRKARLADPARPPDDQRRPRAFAELGEKQVRVGMEAAGRNAALARELGKREVRQGRRVEELAEGARGRRGVGVDRRQASRKSAEPSVAQRRSPGENARKVLSAADLDDDSSQMIQPRMQLGDRLEVPLDLALQPVHGGFVGEGRADAEPVCRDGALTIEPRGMRRGQDLRLLLSAELRQRFLEDRGDPAPIAFGTIVPRVAMELALQRGSSAVTLIDQVDAAVAPANRMLDKIRKLGRAKRFPDELLEGATDILPHEYAALEIEVRRIGRRERHLQVAC